MRNSKPPPIVETNIPTVVKAECSLTAAGRGGSCLAENDESKVLGALNVETMEEARVKTKCDSEKCVVKAAAPVIGQNTARLLLLNNYKIDGPTDNALLSNVNIDTILKQWALSFTDFFPYNFNMLNYTKYNYQNGKMEASPDTLATINVGQLYKDGFRTAACVINSDTYDGGGKHWMALFADMRNPRATIVEFFNSAGGCAEPEWFNWLAKAKRELEDVGLKVSVIDCGRITHQDSMTECGVYSLFYIWCRLNGTAANKFQEQAIPDKCMFRFRQHLFANPKAVDADGKFDWESYKKEVHIKWQ